MDAQYKEFIRGIWEEAWQFGSHGSNVSFDEWFSERFSKAIKKHEMKNRQQKKEDK